VLWIIRNEMDHGKRLWEETVFHYYVLNLTIVFQKSICFCCEDFTFEIYLFCYKFFDFANFQVQEKEICHYEHLHFMDWELKEACILQLNQSFSSLFLIQWWSSISKAVIFMSKVRFSSVALYWHICSFLLGFCERYILPICNKIFFFTFSTSNLVLPEVILQVCVMWQKLTILEYNTQMKAKLYFVNIVVVLAACSFVFHLKLKIVRKGKLILIKNTFITMIENMKLLVISI